MANLEIENREGLVWFKAPKPRRFHRCRPWTIGREGERVTWRCACGNIGWPDLGWVGGKEKNSR